MIIARKVHDVMAREQKGKQPVILRSPKGDVRIQKNYTKTRKDWILTSAFGLLKMTIAPSLMGLPRALYALAMTFIMTFFVFAFISSANAAMYDDSDDIALTTDSRIKTYIYSPNEVYLLVLHYGFQSHIEFSPSETIDTITLGDSYLWKITPLGNKLFIKPMEKNIRTNMTVITNKRTYQFDIVAKELLEGDDKDLVYVVRFQYPRRR